MDENNKLRYTELTDEEKEALHQLQLGKENIRKAYGKLLGFHHDIGSGMNHFQKAADILEDADREESEVIADIVPEDAVDECWTWEIVDKFEDGLLRDVLNADSSVREKMVDGERHINEYEMETRRKREYWD